MTEDPFRFEDAAYVLGALDPAERTRFEAHLRECDECTARVRDLQAVPVALAGAGARADVLAALESAEAPPPLPDTVLAGLLARAARERRRRLTVVGGLAALAAACVIALVVAVWPASSTPPATGARPQALHALVATPLQATAAVVETPWGTRIDLDCRYSTGYGTAYDYGLVVVDQDGGRQQLGTWRVLENRDTRYSSGTSLRRDQIAAIEITLRGTPILRLATS